MLPLSRCRRSHRRAMESGIFLEPGIMRLADKSRWELLFGGHPAMRLPRGCCLSSKCMGLMRSLWIDPCRPTIGFMVGGTP